jgi:hypothetical protein
MRSIDPFHLADETPRHLSSIEPDAATQYANYHHIIAHPLIVHPEPKTYNPAHGTNLPLILPALTHTIYKGIRPTAEKAPTSPIYDLAG